MNRLNSENIARFISNRFGLFIHWGIYSVLARGEWYRKVEFLDNSQCQKYAQMFNPDLFEPQKWAQLASRAGMKYVIFTAKHHDGFCMWDTQYTDFKITNTPYGKDILREVVEAFRAEGLKVGFYYSLLDWNHSDFLIDSFHPLRNRENIEELNAPRNMRRYCQYMRNQVTELLTKYGQIDILWFDFTYPSGNPERPLDDEGRAFAGKNSDDWEAEEMMRLVHDLAPDIITNRRIGLKNAGDLITPEQVIPTDPPAESDGSPALWEGCQTMAPGYWGYCRDQSIWYSPHSCLKMLIEHVAKGGNLLLNIGPDGRGVFPEKAVNILQKFAAWMKLHSVAIYGCGAAPAEWTPPFAVRYTWNSKTSHLYLFLLDWPFRFLNLPELSGKVVFARMLNDGSEIHFRNDNETALHKPPVPRGCVSLEVPHKRPHVAIPVIDLYIDLAL